MQPSSEIVPSLLKGGEPNKRCHKNEALEAGVRQLEARRTAKPAVAADDPAKPAMPESYEHVLNRYRSS